MAARAFITRRRLLGAAALTAGSVAMGARQAWAQTGTAPAVITRDPMRPQIPSGVMTGDVTADRAVVWSRTDRPARMIVEYATTDSFKNARRVIGPAALDDDRLHRRGLICPASPRDRNLLSRGVPGSGGHPGHERSRHGALSYAARADAAATSRCLVGRHRRPGLGHQSRVGRHEDLRDHAPRWTGLLHPLAATTSTPTARLPPRSSSTTGRSGRTSTTEAKSKVAETLDEFRGNIAYNLLDENMRRFNAAVPMLVQWDDHEVRNNWYPGADPRGRRRYTVKSASLLAAVARRAMFEYSPFRIDPDDPERIYRAFSYGPLARRVPDRRAQLSRGRTTPTARTGARGAAILGARSSHGSRQRCSARARRGR